jgi:crossover junction endodeoxyribonuclease RuvC
MRVLGIDPGLHICGYGCLEVGSSGTQLVEAGVIRTEARATLSQRLSRIATDLDQLLDDLAPDVVAIEQLYSHFAHPRTAILMAHARGVILQRCAQRKIEIRHFAATRIKKAVTGNGHASKAQVQRTIQTLLALPTLPEPPDVADAVAAAMCCADSIRADALSKGR